MTSKKGFGDKTAIQAISGAKEPTKKKGPEPKDEELYSERTQILLKQSTKEAIKDLAWQNHLSMNAMINKVLEEYLKKHSK